MSGDVVTIEVGGDGKTFKVHKKLLCNKAPVFAAMFNGNFQESSTGVARLPEDKDDTFEYFLGWLYRGTLDTLQDALQFYDLYGFAEKYNLVELMDMTIDALNGFFASNKFLPAGETLDYIYEITHEKSKLRTLVLRCYTYATVEFTDSGSWTTESMLPSGPNAMEAITDIFRQLRDLKNSTSRSSGVGGTLLSDPRKYQPCQYHVHAKGEPCPSKKD